MLVTVAYRMAVASFVGPSQAAMDARMPVGELALDGVAGDDGIVHQQPSAMISVATETCCMSMPST